MKVKITRNKVLYWVVLNLGTLLLAAGVYFFKAPNNFATGGVSGISIILSKFITPHVSWLDQTTLMTIMNVFLLIIGFIFLGKGCTFKTAYCSLVYTAEMQLMRLIPVQLPLTSANGEVEVFLEFVYAMLLTAAGSAIIFNCQASSGGTDIIALIIKKYTKMDTGKALLVTDFLIAGSTFFIFDMQTGLYSLLGLFAKAFIVDGVIENMSKTKYVQIITANPDLIAPFIIEGIHRSYTSFKAVGGYTGIEKTVMITVCKRMEAFKLKTRIHETDSSAFVIITDANEILGRGFREIT